MTGFWFVIFAVYKRHIWTSWTIIGYSRLSRSRCEFDIIHLLIIAMCDKTEYRPILCIIHGSSSSINLIHPSIHQLQADTVALPPPAHSPCSCSSAVGWWSWMSSGNCNPPLSPRETRTPIFDPASFNGENAHSSLGDKKLRKTKPWKI